MCSIPIKLWEPLELRAHVLFISVPGQESELIGWEYGAPGRSSYQAHPVPQICPRMLGCMPRGGGGAPPLPQASAFRGAGGRRGAWRQRLGCCWHMSSGGVKQDSRASVSPVEVCGQWECLFDELIISHPAFVLRRKGRACWNPCSGFQFYRRSKGPAPSHMGSRG